MTTAVTLFAGPATLQCGPRYHNQSVIFRYVIDGTIRTLSNTNPPAQESYKGLFFVPSLEDDDEVCNNITAPFIPSNVTRRADVPPFDHNIIGLAPWVTPECTQAYLAASRRENARTLIFYQPENRDSGKPPPSDNAVWDLGDGGQWKKDNQYPVYAVPGPAGTHLMSQLSQYSGHASDYNSSSNGNNSTNMTEAQARGDCARFYALLDLEPTQSSTVPGIWVFVLAILGAIVLMMAFAYFTMMHVQRRRRESLQRRLVTGEVDLEYLGIKRLVVPPQLLSQLPVYVYPVEEVDEKDEKGPSSSSPKEDDETKVSEEKTTQQQNDNLITNESQDESISAILEEIMPNLQPPPRAHTAENEGAENNNHHRLTFSQRTCAICLDDFVPGTSLVRELPCTHIFHPECVDTFLMRDGSTCPVCKHNVLPPSFIEYQVSNLMVRREQRIRRLQRYREYQDHHRHRHQRHYDYHHRSPIHETQLPDLPLSLPSYLPALNRINARLRAWLHLNDSHDEGRAEEELGVGVVDSPIQRPPEAVPNDSSRGESFDPVRRQMMQRRAMVLLGRPVSDRNVSPSSSSEHH